MVLKFWLFLILIIWQFKSICLLGVVLVLGGLTVVDGETYSLLPFAPIFTSTTLKLLRLIVEVDEVGNGVADVSNEKLYRITC